MKLLKITINPKTLFASKIEGDTLFGLICWSILYQKGQNFLEELLEDYKKEPFCIVSDGFFSGYLPKPTLPKEILQETDIRLKKEYKKRNFIKIDDLLKGELKSVEIKYPKKIYQVQNKIDRKAFKTGENFAPYEVEYYEYDKTDIYILINKEENLIIDSLALIGEIGYAKDASISKGQFDIKNIEDVTSFFKQADFYMALSSFCLKGIKNCYYDVYTKFPKTLGKNPFKNPLILAKTSAVIMDNKTLYYVGCGIDNFSNDSKILHQGYAITLPIGATNEI